MQHENTVLHAVIKALPRWRFERLARRHGADHRVRTLPTWSQMVALIYGQLAGARSLRELVAALASHGNLLYHLGVGVVRRSTLADANATRPIAVFSDVFALLLGHLQPKLAGAAQDAIRLLDATVIQLGALATWARFSDASTAAKVHVVFDPEAQLPTYFAITPAKVNDIVEAKRMPIEPGATYVFDKGYYDFGFWAALDARGCRFVTRLKVNSPLTVLAERPCDDAGILSDRVVRLNERMARNRRNPYQTPVREIVVQVEQARTLRLVTNDLAAPAREIAQLYKTRWQIELFFRWVKQNLKIKKFFGTSEHAIKLQIITALIAYLLLRLAQTAWPTTLSLQQLARLVRANLMHKKTIPDLLHPPPRPGPRPATPQLSMNFNHVHP
jgi:IS4 transposase